MRAIKCPYCNGCETWEEDTVEGPIVIVCPVCRGKGWVEDEGAER